MCLLLSVHLLKSSGGLLVASELDEAEAAGAHGLAVLDDNLDRKVRRNARRDEMR